MSSTNNSTISNSNGSHWLNSNSNTSSPSNPSSNKWDQLPKEVKIAILKQLDCQSIARVSQTNKLNLQVVNENLQYKKVEKFLKDKALKNLENCPVKKCTSPAAIYYYASQLIKYLPTEVNSFLEKEIEEIAKNEGDSFGRLKAIVRCLCRKEVFNQYPQVFTPLLGKIVTVIQAIPAENRNDHTDKLFQKIAFRIWGNDVKRALDILQMTRGRKQQAILKLCGKFTALKPDYKSDKGFYFLNKIVDPNVFVQGLVSMLKQCYRQLPDEVRQNIIDKVCKEYKKVNKVSDDKKELFFKTLTQVYAVAGEIDRAKEAALPLEINEQRDAYVLAIIKSPKMFFIILPEIIRILDNDLDQSLEFEKSVYTVNMLMSFIDQNFHLEVTHFIKEHIQDIKIEDQWKLWKTLAEKFKTDERAGEYREKVAKLGDQICQSEKNPMIQINLLLSIAILFAPFDINRAKSYYDGAMEVLSSQNGTIIDQSSKNKIILQQALYLLFADLKSVTEKLEEISLKGENDLLIEKIRFFVDALDRFF